MGRIFEHSATLSDGTRVGYGLLERGETWYVRFLGPKGERVKRSLGVAKKGQITARAEEVIAKEFRAPADHSDLTWESAIALLQQKFASSGRRPSTLRQYLRDLTLITKFKTTSGPQDIDETFAEKWLEAYTVGKDKRIRDKAKVKKTHSPHNVKARLISLSSLWNKWFVNELGIVASNPFANLDPPKPDKKEVRYITDDQLEIFMRWLGETFGDWPFPTLFFTVKAFSGCRLQDICQLKSVQLREGNIIFPASEAKGRKERPVPLPPALFQQLKEYAGATYLWERYPGELRAILKKKGVPVHQLQTSFDPTRLYPWILNLFTQHRKAGHSPITSHQFRKRAFTLAWKAGINAKEASIAFGCNQDTLLRHYVAMDETSVAASVFERIGSTLLGTSLVDNGTLLGHNFSKTPSNGSEEKAAK